MRPLIVSSEVTVDGFMTGPDNNLDFMVNDPQLEDELTGMLIVRCRHHCRWSQSVLRHGCPLASANGDLAAWLNATPKVVLSTDSSHDVGAWENSTLATGDGADQVRRLKAFSGGGLVTFGGVQTVRSLVAANLVDEYCQGTPGSMGHGGLRVDEHLSPAAIWYSVHSSPVAHVVREASGRPTRPGNQFG